ncbi:hypothetical protein [Streptomyces uncialis]|uniref:hypothetical protein n=1 Tax=Streptomyces uncialis TaxID=1048205 RepID=UPI0033C43CAE
MTGGGRAARTVRAVTDRLPRREGRSTRDGRTPRDGRTAWGDAAPHRAGVLALAMALGAVPLAGCGVQATDVIEAGRPPTLYVPAGYENWMLLFFRAPDGRLLPVARSRTGAVSDQYPPPYSPKALAALLEGPQPADRDFGLSTALPKVNGWAQNGPTQEPKEGDGANTKPKDGTTEVFLSVRLSALDDTAVQQVICTVAYADSIDGSQRVALRGTDALMEPAGCGVDVNWDDVPRPESSPRPKGELMETETPPVPPTPPMDPPQPTDLTWTEIIPPSTAASQSAP